MNREGKTGTRDGEQASCLDSPPTPSRGHSRREAVYLAPVLR